MSTTEAGRNPEPSTDLLTALTDRMITATVQAIEDGAEHGTVTLTTAEAADLVDQITSLKAREKQLVQRTENLSEAYRRTDNVARQHAAHLIRLVPAAKTAAASLAKVGALLRHPSLAAALRNRLDYAEDVRQAAAALNGALAAVEGDRR